MSTPRPPLVQGSSNLQSFLKAKSLHETSPHGLFANGYYHLVTEQQKRDAQACPKLAEATAIYEHCAETAKKTGRLFDQGVAEYQLGLLWHRQGRTKKAENAYYTAIELLRDRLEPNTLPSLSTCHFRLGEILLERGEIEIATDHFQRSHKIDTSLNDIACAAMSEHMLAGLQDSEILFGVERSHRINESSRIHKAISIALVLVALLLLFVPSVRRSLQLHFTQEYEILRFDGGPPPPPPYSESHLFHYKRLQLWLRMKWIASNPTDTIFLFGRRASSEWILLRIILDEEGESLKVSPHLNEIIPRADTVAMVLATGDSTAAGSLVKGGEYTQLPSGLGYSEVILIRPMPFSESINWRRWVATSLDIGSIEFDLAEARRNTQELEVAWWSGPEILVGGRSWMVDKPAVIFSRTESDLWKVIHIAEVEPFTGRFESWAKKAVPGQERYLAAATGRGVNGLRKGQEFVELPKTLKYTKIWIVKEGKNPMRRFSNASAPPAGP